MWLVVFSCSYKYSYTILQTLLQQYLFIDIETVPGEADFTRLSPAMQHLWHKKAATLKALPEADSEALYTERSAIYSEFAKVVCIGIGCLVKKEDGWKIFLKSLTGDDERELLTRFCIALKSFTDREKELVFCGHNIKEFDIPFLCRRMVIHDIELPSCLDIASKKPWEVNHVDTMELWKFGDKKNYTSLELLAEVLGVPTSKDDIDGSMVGAVYWQDHDLERIATYCLKDVQTTARVFMRLKNIKGIDPEPVFLTDKP